MRPSPLVAELEGDAISEAALLRHCYAGAAAEALGWSYTSCDAQGDPQRQGAWATSLINQDGDLLLGLSVEASVIPNQLQQAKDKGIPFLNLGGPVRPDPLIAT